MVSSLVSLLAPALFSLSVSGNLLVKRAPPGTAVITDREFADPAILLQSDGWYAYASGANGMFSSLSFWNAFLLTCDSGPNVQFATAARAQFAGPWDVGPLPGGRDAMPDISAAGWIDQGDSAIFAPDVVDMVRFTDRLLSASNFSREVETTSFTSQQRQLIP